LNEKDVDRAATFSSPILDSVLISSSARPSQKYSFSSSALMFVKGRTATELKLPVSMVSRRSKICVGWFSGGEVV